MFPFFPFTERQKKLATMNLSRPTSELEAQLGKKIEAADIRAAQALRNGAGDRPKLTPLAEPFDFFGEDAAGKRLRFMADVADRAAGQPRNPINVAMFGPEREENPSRSLKASDSTVPRALSGLDAHMLPGGPPPKGAIGRRETVFLTGTGGGPIDRTRNRPIDASKTPQTPDGRGRPGDTFMTGPGGEGQEESLAEEPVRKQKETVARNKARSEAFGDVEHDADKQLRSETLRRTSPERLAEAEKALDTMQLGDRANIEFVTETALTAPLELIDTLRHHRDDHERMSALDRKIQALEEEGNVELARRLKMRRRQALQDRSRNTWALSDEDLRQDLEDLEDIRRVIDDVEGFVEPGLAIVEALKKDKSGILQRVLSGVTLVGSQIDEVDRWIKNYRAELDRRSRE